ncbi:MAG: DegV family protein [Chloroflexi bacterium]|nr:DegV family protein [Chloroflexota bacterium]
MRGRQQDMQNIRVVTDSASDIPPEVAAAHSIVVVPLSIHFGSKTYVSDEDLSGAEFYRLMKTDDSFPRTSQPSVGRFEQAYTQLRDEGAEIISIHLSSKLSGTFAGASAAAKAVDGATVHLVDSLSGSMAEGAMVLAAARMAADGCTAVEIVRYVEMMRGRTHVALMVDNLLHLQRGGRIGRAQSLLGTLLNVKPLISLDNGEVVPRQRVRTVQRALRDMATEAQSSMPLQELRIMHANAPKLVDEFRELLQPIVNREVPAELIGPVIGTHIGEGAIGIVMVQAAPD